MTQKKRIVVAMSGGVDSSVAAALVARGLIRGTGKPVKVLADGEAPKGLKLAIHKVSSAARAKIEAMGGSVETVE